MVIVRSAGGVQASPGDASILVTNCLQHSWRGAQSDAWGHWNHGRAYYRCKFTEDYPGANPGHPKNIYVKEEAVIPGLDTWLASLFDDDHIDDTCTALAGASEPDPNAERREADLRAGIADCDRKLANYRALLDTEDAVWAGRR